VKKIIFPFGVIFVCLFQAAALDSFSILAIKPDLLLICIVFFSFYLPPRQAILFSLFGGILKDVLTPWGFAINTLIFPLWCWSIIKLSRKIAIDNNFLYVAVVFLISVLHNITNGLLLAFLGAAVVWQSALKIVFLGSLYSCLVMFLVLKFIRPRFNT
jgi:rod shape-determining protein MreD